MNKHDHHDCAHVLKFCAPCDEAYCTKCEAVWGTCTLSHYSPYWTGTGGTTASDTGTPTVSHSLC